MAKIRVKRKDSIGDELERVHQAISCRAYALFEKNGIPSGAALNHWLAAERELITRPAVEVRQQGGELLIAAALPGIDPKYVDLQVTADDLLISAEPANGHASSEETVYRCELEHGKRFRSIRFPKPIDPGTARAELTNGMLRVTAAIAPTAAGGGTSPTAI